MTQTEIKQFQKTQLILLDYVDDLCGKLGISYYMIGGTLLGAVRHRGFIPWDADIDIAMMRKDYDSFCEYLQKNPHQDYFLQTYQTEKNHNSPHAILRMNGTHVIYKGRQLGRFAPKHDGIYLDIFPLDDAPVAEKDQRKQMKKLAFLNRVKSLKLAYTYGSKTSFAKKVAKSIGQFLLSPVSVYQLNAWFDKESRKHSGSGSGYVVSMASHYSYKKQLMKADIYGDPVKMQFEDRLYLAPNQTETYLTRLYKNYMELPPENKRYAELEWIDHIEYKGD